MSTAQVNNVAQYGGGANLNNALLTLPTGVAPVIFVMGNTAATDDRRLSFVRTDATGQGRVSSGKTFICIGAYINAGASISVFINYGYNTATFTNNSVPSGDVVYAASATDFAIYAPIAGNTPYWLPFPVTFPSNSYPFMIWHNIAGNRIGATLIGYEI